MDGWLKDCIDNLNAVVFDKITPAVLKFSAQTAITIPPMAEYKGKTKKQKLRGISTSSYANGIDAENVVRNCFGMFAPGGIYLSGLKILSLVRKHGLVSYLPDNIALYSFLKQHANKEIDGLYIHPELGIAIVEIKAVVFSNQSPNVESRNEPKQVFGKDIKKQLKGIEEFVSRLYQTIFGEQIYIPVYKVICTPNAMLQKGKISDDIDLLDKKMLTAKCGASFKEYWRKKMTFVERKTHDANFTKFAAVLISLKTAFGLVSQYTFNIITATPRMISQHESLIHTGNQAPKVKFVERCKTVFFFLNNEQIKVLDARPGQHFLDGVPGSGKTLLLKARVLKLKSDPKRRALIFCPTPLTFQYQQFVDENDITDRVKVKSFSELSKIALIFNNKREKFEKCSEYTDFLSKSVNIYCDEMDVDTLIKTNTLLLLQRPEEDADTFIVRESPDVAQISVDDIFNTEANKFKRHHFQTMMRNSKEIMAFYKSNFDENVVLGHSISTCGIHPEVQGQNRRVVLSEVVKSVRFLLEKGYKHRDLAVISIDRQKREIEYALQLSRIATKSLAKNMRPDAVTVLTPTDVKSYEWKAVIISIDYDHEQEMALAITRAIAEVIIIKDIAYERTIEEKLRIDTQESPEQILLKHALKKDFDTLERDCRAFPHVMHLTHKPTEHCKTVEEYRNWSIYGKLQECGYSAKHLQILGNRVRFEQNDRLRERHSKMQAATLRRNDPNRRSTISLPYDLHRYDGNLHLTKDSVLIRSASNWQLINPSITEISRKNAAINRGFPKANFSRKLNNRSQVLPDEFTLSDSSIFSTKTRNSIAKRPTTIQIVPLRQPMALPPIEGSFSAPKEQLDLPSLVPSISLASSIEEGIEQKARSCRSELTVNLYGPPYPVNEMETTQSASKQSSLMSWSSLPLIPSLNVLNAALAQQRLKARPLFYFSTTFPTSATSIDSASAQSSESSEQTQDFLNQIVDKPSENIGTPLLTSSDRSALSANSTREEDAIERGELDIPKGIVAGRKLTFEMVAKMHSQRRLPP